MSFWLVLKLVTLSDLERRNSHVVCVISPNSVAWWVCCVQWSGAECCWCGWQSINNSSLHCCCCWHVGRKWETASELCSSQWQRYISCAAMWHVYHWYGTCHACWYKAWSELHYWYHCLLRKCRYLSTTNGPLEALFLGRLAGWHLSPLSIGHLGRFLGIWPP